MAFFLFLTSFRHTLHTALLKNQFALLCAIHNDADDDDDDDDDDDNDDDDDDNNDDDNVV